MAETLNKFSTKRTAALPDGHFDGYKRSILEPVVRLWSLLAVASLGAFVLRSIASGEALSTYAVVASLIPLHALHAVCCAGGLLGMRLPYEQLPLLWTLDECLRAFTGLVWGLQWMPMPPALMVFTRLRAIDVYSCISVPLLSQAFPLPLHMRLASAAMLAFCIGFLNAYCGLAWPFANSTAVAALGLLVYEVADGCWRVAYAQRVGAPLQFRGQFQAVLVQALLAARAALSVQAKRALRWRLAARLPAAPGSEQARGQAAMTGASLAEGVVVAKEATQQEEGEGASAGEEDDSVLQGCDALMVDPDEATPDAQGAAGSAGAPAWTDEQVLAWAARMGAKRTAPLHTCRAGCSSAALHCRLLVSLRQRALSPGALLTLEQRLQQHMGPSTLVASVAVRPVPAC